MTYTYQFHPEAQNEYEAALKWYRKKSTVAAENFVMAVDHTLSRICQRPNWWRNTYKHYHELSVKKYPYTIIYVIEETEKSILITAVYHHKRNPKKKYRNIKA